MQRLATGDGLFDPFDLDRLERVKGNLVVRRVPGGFITKDV